MGTFYYTHVQVVLEIVQTHVAIGSPTVATFILLSILAAVYHD